MKVLHLSPIYNRKSILKNGIIPTPVRYWHRPAFQKDGACDKNGYAVYTTGIVMNVEKFLCDHTYCCVFLHPRNKIPFPWKGEDYFDFSKLDGKFLYNYTQMIFDVYEVEVEDNGRWYYHMQEPTDNKYGTCYHFSDKFSHNNKIIFVFPYKLTKVKIVAQTQFYYDVKENIKMLKGINY